MTRARWGVEVVMPVGAGTALPTAPASLITYVWVRSIAWPALVR